MFEQNITLGPGTGTFSQHTFEILIMLLGAFLLGLWLGWALWAKYKQQIDKIVLENQSLNVTTDALRTELTTLKSRLSALENDNNTLATESIVLSSTNNELRDKVNALEAELSGMQTKNEQLDTALGLTNKPDVPDDNLPLEITTPDTTSGKEAASAEAPKTEPDEPEIVLAENNAAPTVIQPIAMAEPEKKKTPAKKAAKEAAKPKPAVSTGAKDDLTVIEGIGPKIQMLLNQYDISNYKQLAETDVDRLKEILSTAGPQLAMHDPGTWPSQANLAENDQWDTLKSVQGFLKGGKKPT